jgi:hypothetical protein
MYVLWKSNGSLNNPRNDVSEKCKALNYSALAGRVTLPVHVTAQSPVALQKELAPTASMLMIHNVKTDKQTTGNHKATTPSTFLSIHCLLCNNL